MRVHFQLCDIMFILSRLKRCEPQLNDGDPERVQIHINISCNKNDFPASCELSLALHAAFLADVCAHKSTAFVKPQLVLAHPPPLITRVAAHPTVKWFF